MNKQSLSFNNVSELLQQRMQKQERIICNYLILGIKWLIPLLLTQGAQVRKVEHLNINYQ